MNYLQTNRLVSFLFILTASFTSSLSLYGQEKEYNDLSQEELINNFYTETDTLIKKALLKNLFELGRKEKNKLTIVTAHNLMSEIVSYQDAIKHLDSAITIAKTIPSEYQPSVSFLHRGKKHFIKNQYELALQDFVSSIEYAEKYENTDLVYSNQYYIALLKNKIGDYNDAKEIFFQTLLDKNIRLGNQFGSLFGVSDAYTKLNLLDSAHFYNNKGLELSIEKENSTWIQYFQLNKAFINYNKRQDFDSTKVQLINKIDFLKEQGDNINLSQTYFYLGNIAYLNKDLDLELQYYNKVDSIFNKNKPVFKGVKKMYLNLIENSKNKNLQSEQLYYTSQLNKLDSIINKHSLIISKNIYKSFDLPKEIAIREQIIDSSEKKIESRNVIILIISILSAISIFLGILIYSRNSKLKKKIDKLIETPAIEKPANNLNDKIKKINNLSNEIVDKILIGLQDFEEQEGFLDNNLNSLLLAKKLKTNTKYLSSILNNIKGNSYTQYINNLRINYCVQRLKSDSKFRNYTISAISEECGYNTAESFSNTFKKHTEVKPSVFINQLNKKN